jgi:hypothetical protein
MELSELPLSHDPRRWLQYKGKGLFHSYNGPEVHWGQELKMTGDYRVELKFSNRDVFQLFKAMNGTTLDVDLLDDHGFTVSPALRQRILRTVKLADLTLADLTGMNEGPTAASEPSQKPFLRKI